VGAYLDADLASVHDNAFEPGEGGAGGATPNGVAGDVGFVGPRLPLP